MQSNADRLLEVVNMAQSQLARFATESFRVDGRGLVQVTVPDFIGEPDTFVATPMAYHTLAGLREKLYGEDADITLRMIETYDPEKQAVVMIEFRGGNPITIKMRLEQQAVAEAGR